MAIKPIKKSPHTPAKKNTNPSKAKARVKIKVKVKEKAKTKVGKPTPVRPIEPVKPKKKNTKSFKTTTPNILAPPKATQPQASKKIRRLESPYEDIRKDLIKQKMAIIAEVGVVMGDGLPHGNEDPSDVGDQASAETTQNFVLRLREREQKLLFKIEDAIERIQDGRFGVCELCGGAISYARLRARPVTDLCIECKTTQEKEERLRES